MPLAQEVLDDLDGLGFSRALGVASLIDRAFRLQGFGFRRGRCLCFVELAGHSLPALDHDKLAIIRMICHT